MTNFNSYSTLPEGVIDARQVASVSAKKFPWLTDREAPVNFTQITFEEGTRALVSSAPTPAMKKLTANVCKKILALNQKTDAPYSTTDQLFYYAARIKAANETPFSVTRVKGSAGMDVFDGFTVEGIHQSQRPNALRIYAACTAAQTILSAHTLEKLELPPQTPTLTRLCIVDKNNQASALQLLSSKSRRNIRSSSNVGR